MKAYEIPDAIQWHEGLLLTPQHFQQLSTRHEALVQYGTSLVAPFCYGVRRLKYDRVSLTMGKFRIQQLESIMPDGLVVVHGLPEARNEDVLEFDLTNVQTGESRILGEKCSCISHIALSPDGERLAASSLDGRIRVWDIRTCRSRTIGECYGVNAIAFTTAVVTGSDDGTVRMWELPR